MKTPKRTAGTGTRDLGSAGTPEYIKMEAGKINPLRTVQCRSYIHDIDVGKRESETERGGGRDFHSNVSKVEQRILLICHYFVHIVKINCIFICTLLSDI